VHCPLRLVNEPDGSYSVRGPFSINGERFVNSTPIALEVLERLKRGCGVVGGGAGGANGNAASANGNHGSSDVEDSAFQSVGSGSSGPSGTGADVATQTKNFQPEPPPAGVPSPIAGAGLPGLLAGLGTMLAWFRKRRAARVSHRRFLGGRLFIIAHYQPVHSRSRASQKTAHIAAYFLKGFRWKLWHSVLYV
jgi:hypothetical protein